MVLPPPPVASPHNLLAVDEAAFRLAHEVGFHGVCSAYCAYNWPGGHPFHLRRIHADPELIRMKNWLSVDPRKLGHMLCPSIERFPLSRCRSLY